MKYETAQNGQWIRPKRRGWRMQCCDCGLVHRVDFKLVKVLNGGSAILLRAFRDNRASAQRRRNLPT